MPSTAVAAVQRPSSWYLIPSHLNLHSHAHHKKNLTTLSLASEDSKNPIGNFCALTLPKPHSCSKGQENYYSLGYKSNSSQNHYHHLFLQFSPSIDTKGSNNRNSETRNQKKQQVDEEKGFKNKKETRLLFSNMWWADVKAALGQRINLEAIFSTFVVVKDPKLALPNISVPDMRFIDWSELRRKGFRGVVFDKDNTITAPYSLTPWPPLGSSLERCKLEFGPDNIAVFSNSAGLHEYDPDGFKARALEEAIGLKVIRHRVKKPAGTAEEVEKHFGCDSSQLIMVGDRPFTDIVYGNRNGFLTILTNPLSLVEEPFIVRQVRKLETSFVNHWQRRGLKPSGHKLLPDPMVCVREPPAW